MNTNYCKQAQQRILSSLAAATIALAFSPAASADNPKPDAELLRLEADLDAATSQGGINIASQKISDYWDRKLAELEKKVALKLTADERVQFEASKKRFSVYREKEVEFRTSFSGRGTIRPLMSSGAYSRITEQRVRELEILIVDVLHARVDNP